MRKALIKNILLFAMGCSTANLLAQGSNLSPSLIAKANAGDSIAQFQLGYAYELGQVVPQDLSQAAFWYKKAANNGDAGAQYNLALLYATGQGVPQDDAEAYFWADIAASKKVNGIQPSVLNALRDQTGSMLSRDVLLRTQARVRAWTTAHESDSKTKTKT